MQTIKVKTWRFLNPHTMSPSDLEWLEKNCSRVDYTRQDPIPIAVGNQVRYMAGQAQLKVLTNSDKQEMMLHLKYSDRIALEHYTNVYSTITALG